MWRRTLVKLQPDHIRVIFEVEISAEHGAWPRTLGRPLHLGADHNEEALLIMSQLYAQAEVCQAVSTKLIPGRIQCMARAKPTDSCPFFACHCIRVSGCGVPAGIFLYHVRISRIFTRVRSLPNASGSFKAPVFSVLSSLCAGVGLVALINAVGVYV